MREFGISICNAVLEVAHYGGLLRFFTPAYDVTASPLTWSTPTREGELESSELRWLALSGGLKINTKGTCQSFYTREENNSKLNFNTFRILLSNHFNTEEAIFNHELGPNL